MARTSLWLGDVQGAETDLGKAIAAGAPAADTAGMDAEIKLALHQYSELQAAMERNPAGLSESARLMYLGYAQLGQGDSAAALQSFDAAVKSAPPGAESSRARKAQAEAMAAAGDAAGAMVAIDELLAADPGYQPAHARQGQPARAARRSCRGGEDPHRHEPGQGQRAVESLRSPERARHAD